MSSWQLAQVNLARAREPLDRPLLADFVAALEPINALAGAADGFVWRLQGEGGDATSIRAFDDDLVIINMSVWESLEQLWRFVYASGHLAVMRRRREWFERMATSYLALWWVPLGELPDLDDAARRLSHREAHGSTAHAFDFRQPFDPAGRPLDAAAIRRVEPAPCG